MAKKVINKDEVAFKARMLRIQKEGGHSNEEMVTWLKKLQEIIEDCRKTLTQ